MTQHPSDGFDIAAALQLLDKQAPQAGQAAREAMAGVWSEELGDPWRIYDLREAYKPRAPQQYVVSGLFLRGSLNLPFGAPGTLKSMLLADLCVCVAAGVPWLPPLPGEDDVVPRGVIQGPALWLDFDNGLRRTNERLEALARARDLDPATTPLHYCSMPTPWLDASDALSMTDLARRIEGLGAVLVVIDNLGNVIGKADENSTDMATVMGSFRRLAEETQAAIVLVHHQRKSVGFSSRAGESLRGHSSIEAALDLALLIEREERADSVKVKSTKSRGVDVAPFGAQFAYEHRADSDELGTALFYGLQVEDLVSDKAIQALILEIVGAAPNVNQSDLVAQIRANLPNAGINKVRDNINHLATTGELTFKKGAHNAYLYCIPEHEQAEMELEGP